MKRSRIGIFTSLIILFLVSCSTFKRVERSTTEIMPLSDTVTLKEGTVVYALPRTVLTVEIEAERVLEIPGPYSKYAEELLGIKGVITDRQEKWSIKGIRVNSHEEADPSELYVIQSYGRFMTNALELKKEGLILDLNPQDEIPAITLSGKRAMYSDQIIWTDLGSDEYYTVQTDTAFRRVKVDAEFIRIPYIVEKKKILSTDQLAERAARRLMELRDGKLLILTGEANVFPQDAAAIDEINRLEKDYTELFTGKTISESKIYSYQYIPSQDNNGNAVALFMFSGIEGPLEAVTGSGKNVSIVITPELKTKDITILNSNKETYPSASTDKLFYRIPDMASVKITLDGVVLFSSRKLIYQLGEVLQLPSNLIIGK